MPECTVDFTIANGILECHGHKFRIVSQLPMDMRVWNIGRNMPEGWLPLCKLLNSPDPWKAKYWIDPDQLCCIPCKEAWEVMHITTMTGVGNIAEMEEYLKHRHKYHDQVKTALRILTELQNR